MENKDRVMVKVEVISADSGLPEGTQVSFDDDTDKFVHVYHDTDIGDGYKMENTNVVSYSREFVEDNIGLLFKPIGWIENAEGNEKVKEPKKEGPSKDKNVLKKQEQDPAIQMFRSFDTMIMEMNDLFEKQWKRFETIMNDMIYGK